MLNILQMVVEQILTEELENLKSDITSRIEASGQTASGNTAKSLEVEAKDYSGQLTGASYIGVLETGRKPGRVPREFIDILKRWAQAKGISFSDEKQFNLWANAVKWKIIREGTKLYRSGQNEDIFDSSVKKFEDKLNERIAVFYQSQIANEIFNF